MSKLDDMDINRLMKTFSVIKQLSIQYNSIQYQKWFLWTLSVKKSQPTGKKRESKMKTFKDLNCAQCMFRY